MAAYQLGVLAQMTVNRDVKAEKDWKMVAPMYSSMLSFSIKSKWSAAMMK